jgi:transcriptional regulator with GAF, ATPase, and Fis domain
MEDPGTSQSDDNLRQELRRYIRILVDIGRLVSEHADLNRLLGQVVVQIARAVEIHHVKVLQYRPRTSDLLIVAGVGWKEGVVGRPPYLLTCVHPLDTPLKQRNR